MALISNSSPPTAETRELEGNGHDSESDLQDDPVRDSYSQDEAQDLENTLSRVSSGPPYTIFSPRMKRWIVAMNCIAAFMSPITANIYFPAIPTLSRDLGVGVDQINLTLTTYMIFQALAPTIFGDFGDIAGRRPAFIIAFVIYLGANIGLALQRNYAALLVLRMLQSGGSSGTIALVYAVVADIAPSSERGKWMGIVGSGITIGPSIGPGGLLNAYLGWPWIFWFLIILTVSWLIPYILAVPETARKVVGNGSIPPQGWNITLIDYLRFRNKNITRSSVIKKQKIPIPNPLNTLKVLGNKNMAMILFYNATLFVGFSTVTATLATQFQQIYGYDELTLGLLYLPIGGSTTIASIGGGFIADWNFRRIAKKLGMKVDGKRGMDLADFPLEKARIQLIFPLIFVGTGALIGYGWALERQVSVAVPLVLSFFIGLCVTWPFQIMNLLIVDSYPGAPATATAANNLVRCLTGAAATASIEPIIRAIGRGWAFTILALLFTLPSPVLWIIVKHGPRWRQERIQKMMEEAEKKVESNEEIMPVDGNEPKDG
ncbi:chloramphenicol resistance protein [Hypoxylon argillaceum]|nr:chloramphenicol resistance protein [Hypoxylon argillaceum]KAI1149281.1 chloramphenicol resistance protein [Nemania diffusa]